MENSSLPTLSACHVSDALAAQGLPAAAGLTGLHPLDPVHRIEGRAFTVSYAPATGNGRRPIEYLAHVSPGDVLILAHEGRLDCSVWGGQRTIGALQRGAVGTIVDGAFRDIPEHIELGYPVWGRGHTIVSSRDHVVPVAWGETVTVCGTEILPGDWVVADGSGVVVVPAAVEAETRQRANEILEQEAEIASAVDAGSDFVATRAAARGATDAAR